MTARARGRRLAIPLVFAACLVLGPECARAQSNTTSHPVEVSFGGWWTASSSVDTLEPGLKRPAGGSLRLFAADGELGPGVIFEPRFTVGVSRILDLEASAALGRRDLRIRVTDDFEGADDLTISERLHEISVSGAVVVHLRPRSSAARITPFVIAGGGYFWEYHEGDTLSETGQQFFVGGGFKQAFRVRTDPRARINALGLRVEGRVIGRTAGAALDDRVHVLPALGASFFMRF